MQHSFYRLSPRHAAALAALAVTGLLSACGADGYQPRTLQVPSQYDTIQAAVDDARDGDLVLIAAGAYHESVRIDTDGVVVRGEDRNTVVLDGRDQLGDGFFVTADEVAVENLTVTGYRFNGVIFNGADESPSEPDGVAGRGSDALVGYRVQSVTAYNNGAYGVYAFASRDGLIDDVYVSGHPDSGVYVGQCDPCNVVVSESTAEHNAIGFLFTNTSHNAQVLRSVARSNRLGIAVNSDYAEYLAPATGVEVAGNLVVDNDNPDTPAIAQGFFGGGIALGGSSDVTVTRNWVGGHDGIGILLTPLRDFQPTGNTITDNVMANNTVDLGFVTAQVGDGLSNCFADNQPASTHPDGLEMSLPCPAVAARIDATASYDGPPAPPGVDYRKLPAPAPQPGMSNPAGPPTRPAAVAPVALDEITVPAV